jgi:hypothetical protein
MPTLDKTAKPMSDILPEGKQLYAALRTANLKVLHARLSPDFRGELTSGLPLGLGGIYEGLEVMIGSGWGVVGEHFTRAPQVNRFYDGGDVMIGEGSSPFLITAERHDYARIRVIRNGMCGPAQTTAHTQRKMPTGRGR